MEDDEKDLSGLLTEEEEKTMYYELEWLSDLALIPAWGIALIGFAAGALVVGLMWFFS